MTPDTRKVAHFPFVVVTTIHGPMPIHENWLDVDGAINRWKNAGLPKEEKFVPEYVQVSPSRRRRKDPEA